MDKKPCIDQGRYQSLTWYSASILVILVTLGENHDWMNWVIKNIYAIKFMANLILLHSHYSGIVCSNWVAKLPCRLHYWYYKQRKMITLFPTFYHCGNQSFQSGTLCSQSMISMVAMHVPKQGMLMVLWPKEDSPFQLEMWWKYFSLVTDSYGFLYAWPSWLLALLPLLLVQSNFC